ncbi:adhesion G protein-coupled receptor B1-like [Vicugna pacos]|uniref:Adhesion G protein-coupled receptor B1-like n=1 Tax=Vicugna pacos TaxID=30538 RepID=A0ABM5CGM6_VICPA
MPCCPASRILAAPPARMRGQAAGPGALWIFDLLLLLLLLLLGCQPCVASRLNVRPGTGPCPMLVQGEFFGYFLVASEFPANTSCCTWTLCKLDPRHYRLYMKVAKVPTFSSPASICIYQLESFLESTPSYLGLESCDEVLRLYNPSGPLAFLQASKQFLQMKGQQLPPDDDLIPSPALHGLLKSVLLLGTLPPPYEEGRASLLKRWGSTLSQHQATDTL